MKITINEVDYTLKFSYRAFKLLAEKWKLEFVQDVFTKVAESVESAAVDTYVDLIWAGVCGAKDVGGVDILDVGDWLFENMGKIPEITKLLVDSFPKGMPEEPGKPIAAIAPPKG